MSDTKGRAASGLRNPRFPRSKFAPPVLGARLVHRRRLLDDLDRGQDARLTLVVASPGAGKTVLMADWLATRPEWPSAWLNCDGADADPVRFVAALVEAMRRGWGEANLGEDALELLSLDGQVSADVVAALAEDLESAEPRVLVVDDCHLTGGGGADALGLLLDYRPPVLQLVVGTRVDPPLRLHRMRANAELVELRDADLSFSTDETQLLLSGFDVTLSEPALTQIHRRTEGWAVGLQMAALSIGKAPDPSRATDRLELDRHSVAGYFLEEVLYRQPADVADFMLATSVLDELSPPACRAVYGEAGPTMLDVAYGAHMFLTVADAESGTYRYHHLIREVLRAELHARDPERERRLHSVAAQYLADAGQVGPAVRHLLAAGDTAGAFDLLSDRLIVDFSSTPALGSALDSAEIQPELFAGAPQILVPLAADLILRGAFERGSRALGLAQEIPIDADHQPRLAFQRAVVGCMRSAYVGDLEQSLAFEQQARARVMEAVPADWLVAIDAVAMYCYTYLGQFPRAREHADAVVAAQVTPPAAREVLCPGVVSQVALAEGELGEAHRLSSGALESARRLGFERHYFAFTGLRTTALLALERRDLEAAADVTEEILAMLQGGRPIFDFLAQLDRARIWAAAGNVDEALASLPAARAALQNAHSVLLSDADEMEARLRLAVGDHKGALAVAERLAEHRRLIVTAIVALGRGDDRQAAEVLGHAPEAGGTTRSDLELRLLRAAVAIRQRSFRAPQLAGEALVIAERHGFVQTVLDTSPQLVEYLLSEEVRYPATDHLRALVAAGLDARNRRRHRGKGTDLPDPLTDAEIRVLHTLPQRLTYLEMASALHLSLNTIKTHLRHTYMKLGVTSRSAAVKRASALGLL